MMQFDSCVWNESMKQPMQFVYSIIGCLGMLLLLRDALICIPLSWKMQHWSRCDNRTSSTSDTILPKGCGADGWFMGRLSCYDRYADSRNYNVAMYVDDTFYC